MRMLLDMIGTGVFVNGDDMNSNRELEITLLSWLEASSARFEGLEAFFALMSNCSRSTFWRYAYLS